MEGQNWSNSQDFRSLPALRRSVSSLTLRRLGIASAVPLEGTCMHMTGICRRGTQAGKLVKCLDSSRLGQAAGFGFGSEPLCPTAIVPFSNASESSSAASQVFQACARGKEPLLRSLALAGAWQSLLSSHHHHHPIRPRHGHSPFAAVSTALFTSVTEMPVIYLCQHNSSLKSPIHPVPALHSLWSYSVH